MTSALLEAVLRVDVLAERQLRAGARVVAAGRIPLMPPRRRKAREQLADLRGERRRADRLGQDAQAGALERLLRRRAPRGSRRETPTTAESRRGWSASASDRDRRGRAPRPARTRRSRRGCRDAAGCPRSWSAALRGSRPAGRSRRRRASSPSRRTAACPGRCSSGCRTYGTIFSAGCRVQAVTPASASDAPISFRNVRALDRIGDRLDLRTGNSLYRRSWNAGSSGLLVERPPAAFAA